MKASMDSTKSITFTAENDQDVFALGRLAQITRTKASKFPGDPFRLTLTIENLLDAALSQ